MRALVVAVALLVPGVASAHVELLEPAARYPREFLKDGPCGHPGNPPGEFTTRVTAGETLVVRWDEFVGHPGHFRIALSMGGDAELVDPSDFDDFYSADNVLLDEIEDPDGRTLHEVEITIPDVSCESCTLQLIQVMTDKPPWGPDGGRDLYYQCADLEIVGGSTEVPGVTAEDGGGAGGDAEGGADDEDGGCAVAGRRRGSAGSAFMLGLLLVAAVQVTRTRRSRYRAGRCAGSPRSPS